MALPYVISEVADLNALDEAIRPLYVEKDDKFFLDVEGVKPQSEFDTVYQSLQESRKEFKAAKEAASKFGDLTPEAIATMKDELEELRTKAADGGVSDEKLQELVEIRSRPLARQKETLEKSLNDANAKIQALEGTLLERDRKEAIRELAEGLVQPQFMRDVEYRAKAELHFDAEREGFYDEAGATAQEWMNRQLELTPGWVMPSNGAGAAGGKGNGKSSNNPFQPGPSFSLSEQMRLMAEDPKRAEQLKNSVRH